MSISEHQEYLERRRRECLDKSKTATDPSVAKLHRSFAKHYARALKDLAADGPNPPAQQD